MPAKSIALPVSNLPRTAPRLSRRTTKPLWILGLVVIAALAVTVSKVLAASSPSTSNVLTPGLQLAAGTLNLEGTSQAVGATQAAKLLPLWELLAQLNSSGSAAPEEITATIEAIKLNMTAAQISAIDAMPASDLSLGAAGASTASRTSTSTKTSSSAASNPMLGGDLGGAPLDGGGPMPSGSSQSTSSTKTTAAVSGPIQQVIALLKSKVQS